MESDEEIAAAIVALLLVEKKLKKRKRSAWVKPLLGRGINLGLYETLVQELIFEDESEYKKPITELTSHKQLSPSQASINDSVLIVFAMAKKSCEI